MGRPLTRVPAATARARIADGWLGRDAEMTLGSVALRTHQRDAIARARAALDTHGGALIADDVGLGKTFIALALATGARCPLVVGPAALRAMWAEACVRTGVRAEYRSYEAISRHPMPSGRHDLVILDEAHHARSPRTARYRHLAHGLVGARVVLLTATPIHNSHRDLRSLLALFQGALAWTIDESELATHVIRREHEDVSSDAPLPALAPPRPVEIPDDAELLDAIVSLPPPVPARDGGDGGALLSFTLARLWASSHFALRASLRRRLQRARALEDALACGRHPTQRELRAWAIGDDAAQLAFPELVAAPAASDASELLSAVQVHASAVEALLTRLPAESAIDRERAHRLCEVAARHPGEKIIAFTQFADTATALFRLLREQVRCCQLDGRGARVAGGPLSRREALAQFAPRASGAAAAPSSDRIDLLLATDLLSEGVNLQDASVVVHLDLPWTSARMAQRVGRSRRLGALHATTAVYAFAPPASVETLLRQEQRLREKLHAAARLTGACGAILPVRLTFTPEVLPEETPAPTRALEVVRGVVGQWRSDRAIVSSDEALPVAAVRAHQAGALALVRHDATRSLVALLGGRISDRPAELLAAASLAGGPDADGGDDAITDAIERVRAWLAARAGAMAAGAPQSIAGPARRVAMQRIAHIAARTPLHHRGHLAPLTADARRIVTAPYGVGAERVLAELAGALLPDEAWLRAVRAFGEANCAGAGGAGGPEAIEAIIVFEP